MFWILLTLYIGTTVLTGLLQKAPHVKASALGELQVPTAEEGRNLPVFWGTCCLKAPNVVWYGDYRVRAIKKSMGWMSFGRTYTAGYKYFLGMDLALCHGQVDALVDVMAGTGGDLKSVSFTQPETNPDGSKKVHVDDPNCFGGEEKEGGLQGWGTFYYGSSTQESNGYMSNKLDITYPAYRNVCHMVCNQWYLGTQQYIKNLAFVLRRCPSNLGLSGAQTNIDGDANPAEIIYECLQAKAWALGFPAPQFDEDSFYDAGVTLADEGLGISMLLDSPKEADKVIETILQHIDGVCYTDPATGLWTLKLIRPDYDLESIPEYGQDEIAECEFSRGSWEDTVNEIKVLYTERDTWKQGMVQAQEPANFAIRNGELATKSMDFSGFSNAAAAQKVCNRELRTHSYPIGKGRIKINRKAWALRMGSPFKLTWPALGINQMAVRVTGIDYGSLTDGMMEVEICEDVFNAAYTAYDPPSGSGWTDPNAGTPLAPEAQLLHEVPYQLLEAVERRLLAGAVQADGSCDSFEVWTDDGGGYYQTNTVDLFTPSGTLTAAYPRNTDAVDATGFTVSGTDLEDVVNTDDAGLYRGDSLLLIEDAGGSYELCAFKTIVDNQDGTYTISNVVRAVFDTLPLDHALGARVWIIRDGGRFNTAITRDVAYPEDQTVYAKMLPHNDRGTIDIGSVSAVSATTESRAQLPYPPGKVQINGQYWPDGAHIGAVDAVLTWAHRNRTAQEGSGIVAQDAGSVSGGQEGTYTVEVLIDEVLKRTQGGLTGTEYTYTLAMRTADDADLNKPVQFRITPVNGSLTGTKRTTDPFIMQP